MSLGWLTESALIPKPAKEIKVSEGSLADLKAVVYEQETKKRQQEAFGTQRAPTKKVRKLLV